MTSQCDGKEAAVRWIDFVWSDEGTELMNWGIKGVTYDTVDGEKPQEKMKDYGIEEYKEVLNAAYGRYLDKIE